MEPIIRKAIEGGGFLNHSGYYKSTDKLVSIEYLYGTVAIMGDEHGYKHRVHFEAIVMAQSFWQSLGKACGWKPESKDYAEWLGHALQFHEINLNEGWEQGVAYLLEVTK